MKDIENWNAKFELDNFTEDEEKILTQMGLSGEIRKTFLNHSSIASLGSYSSSFFATKLMANESKDSSKSSTSLMNKVKVKLIINQENIPLTVDSRTTLLDALRERIGLTGTKKGCDHGQCGACTVIIDGKRKLSCLTLAASCENKEITTIEGIAKDGKMHPMQEAFVKHDGFQCGYCTPGQICSSIALIEEAKNGEASYVTDDFKSVKKNLKLNEEEIRERMSGNICRCGAYNNIVQAIQEVHNGKDEKPRWEFATTAQMEKASKA